MSRDKMDDDVEMVELNTEEDDDGRDGVLNDSSLRRNNTICHHRTWLNVGALCLCLLIGFFIGSSRHHIINSSAESNLEAFDKEPQNDNFNDDKITKWLESYVTLQDGIKYEIVQQLQHDKASFTEGLCYANGKLYESIGLWKESALLVLDPKTGETLERYPMDEMYFAEGLTHVNGKLIQLTYKKLDGFIYDVNNLTATPTKFRFRSTNNEGWGLTYDPDKHELIESDGSEFLHFWDPETMEEKRKVSITRLSGGTAQSINELAQSINELEYWRGRVLAK
jgi:glutamine cyclotransferase